MRVLGISALYHDSAAASVDDGRIVAAAQEERFTRKKHDARFPRSAIDYCLSATGVGLRDIDYVVFYDKPFLKFERLLETYLAFAPRGFHSFSMAMPVWLKEKLFQKSLLKAELRRFDPDVRPGEPAAVRRAPSEPCRERFLSLAVRARQRCSPWTASASGRRPRSASAAAIDLEMLKEIHFPHSLGLLYSAFTYYTGFKVNSGEYKVMGLAPYGEPRYAQLILEQPDRPEAGRLVPAGSRLLRLLHRPAHDQREVRRALRRPAAAAGRAADAAPHGPCRLDPGGDRRGRAAPDPRDRAPRPAMREPVPRRRRRAQLRRQRQGAAGRAVRADCGSSRRRAMPAARSARPSAAYHLFKDQPRRVATRLDGMTGAYLGPAFAQTEIEERLTAAGRALRRAERRRPDWSTPRRRWPRARRSAGSRDAWSSVRGRSAPARSSATRARPTMQ